MRVALGVAMLLCSEAYLVAGKGARSPLSGGSLLGGRNLGSSRAAASGVVKLELGREVDDVGFDGASDGPDGEICTTVECTVDRIRGGAAAAVAITNRQRGLFLLTYMGYVAIYFARKPMSVVKPVLEETMGISRDALSMVDTSLLGAYAAGQLTLGAVAKFMTNKQMITLSFLLSGLATAAIGLANSAPAMAAASAVAGYSAACLNPLLVIFIADTFPASMRASVVGLWQTSQQSGGIAANNFASAVLGSSGWRSVFILSGLVVAVFSPLMLAVLPNGASKAVPTKGAIKAGETKPSADGPGVAEMATLKGVLPLCSSYMLVKMARYCLMLWLPTFFTSRVGMSAAKAGAMASIFDAGGVAGSLCAGIATDTLLGGRMILVCLPLCLLCSLSFVGWGFLNGQGELVNIMCMALSGFLIAGPDGILGGAASKNLCDYHGKSSSFASAVSGMVNGVASCGVIAMSAFTSKIVSKLGWSGLFLLLGSMMGAASALMISAIAVEHKHFSK